MDKNVELIDQAQREAIKDEMVELREKGKYELAIEGLRAVIQWDETHANPKGKFDVLGHIRIAYVDWASNTRT